MGRGRHKITQPANIVSSSMIILLQLIVTQKVMDDILNVLVLSFTGLYTCGAIFLLLLSTQVFSIFFSINRTRAEE